MDRKRPLLLNEGETRADRALKEAVATHGLTIDRKVKLSSVLEIARSGLKYEDFNYATRAELDFVVSAGRERFPQFAVEFDGAQHLTDPTTIHRDRQKERICQRLGLPLLRIGVEALSRQRKRTILAWLVDVFCMAESFYEQQARGVIPPDEDFMYFGVFDARPDGGLGQAFALDQEARLAMFKANALGLAPTHVPEQVTTDSFRRDPRPEIIESYALFELRDANFIVGSASIRNFEHFGGVEASELAGDLAVADAGKHLDLYRRGRYRPMNFDGLKRIREKTKGWQRTGSPCSDLPFAPIKQSA